MHNLVESMKIAALGAVRSSNPVSIEFGEVMSVSPLRIQIENSFSVEGDELVVPRNLTDFDTEFTYEYKTEEINDHQHTVDITGVMLTSLAGPTPAPPGVMLPTSQAGKHLHTYKQERGTYTIHNKLIVGEMVILYRVQGGQRWVVLDRIGVPY